MKRTLWPLLGAFAICVGASAASAAADRLDEDQILVLACLENLEDSTSWPQCSALLFQPCAQEEVGSDGHVACLQVQRDRWSASADGLRDDVSDALVPDAATELADLLAQWSGFVVKKCENVAAQRVETGADSARLGCEITELTGLSGELAACLEGRSVAEYCKFE